MPQVTVRWVAADGSVKQEQSTQLTGVVHGAQWTWIDVAEPDRGIVEALGERFDLHPLAIEDAFHPQVRAKVDAYPKGLFIAWLTPQKRAGDGVETRELDVFLGQDYLITLHGEVCEAIDLVASQEDRSMRAGADWTLHAIIDLLVDSTLPLVDDIGEELAAVEDAMLDNPRQEELRRLHQVRRQLVKLHRIVAPERDVVRSVGRERAVVDEETYRYFQDVSDHLARVQDSIETYQDVGASVMDIYLSAQNNRMNEIMKQLTVVATIFMPLTLLSGIYGMNVVLGMWPPINRFWSFPAVVGSMVAIAVVMAVYFRKKNWW